ncbi:MAG: PAS domain-containing protein, partial [Desulfobacterota bacterium]|nr:PAS domain-containing protein [Thermodesulfobacteriota bacterium]
MPNKPTYQDLLKRIKALEKEAEGRRKVEEELREGREHLRSLMESASNFAVYRLVYDPENPYKLRVVFVSPSLKDILGLDDPQQFETWFANMHPDDVERMVAANQNAFATFRFNEIYRT